MGQELHPHVELHGSSFGGKLDALGFVALHDAQRNLSQRTGNGQRVGVESHAFGVAAQVAQFVGGNLFGQFGLHFRVVEAFFQRGQVVEVGKAVVNHLLHLRNKFYFTLKFGYGHSCAVFV